MIELKALNLHWLENIKSEEDLCAHSTVYLKIGNRIVSDESLGDFTVSAATYYLLKTIKENHEGKAAIQLIPHCGTIWELSYENELVMIGCDFGINWMISHTQDKVAHKFEDEIIETDFDEWREVVCNFSDDVLKFYEISSPKIFEGEEDKNAFELFMKEWKKLRAEAFN